LEQQELEVLPSRIEARGEHIMAAKSITEEERNKQTIREFTRVFKNEHNADGSVKGFI
jgi:hypothetical protein